MHQAENSGAPAEANPDTLLAAHVEAMFVEFLERRPSEQDLDHWMGVGSLRALIDGVLASEEYAARVARRATREGQSAEGPFLNCWVAGLERFARPVGSISPDGVAIVGERGHLFIHGGSNNNLAMHRGEAPLASGWSAQWRELVEERIAQARAADRALCCLVVPDKLAVYGDLFPLDLDSPERPRPMIRLVEEASVPLLYPCGLLRDARAHGDTYMVTDSHLTGLGNRLLARTTIAALGVRAELLEEVSDARVEHLLSGDLGRHFQPNVLEIGKHLSTPSRARIVCDNWPDVLAKGGHIGTRRIFRRDDAADARTVVVFGDSYGFGDDANTGLSWFLAQAFREVHFVWVPFGWDPDYLDRVGAELVVCQTAERFIGRVPRRRVDVDSLIRDVSGGALGLERAFGDVKVG
ncbi:MAG TPA: hypothetical protein VK272_02430 [Solirubrobacteraceae bacterium]|nr:hypothetical protein [Solirubrobacteraceae bacterium]